MRETACPSQGLRATAATVQIRNGCPQVGCLVWPAVWAGLGLSPHLLPQPGRPCEGHAHACIPPGGSGDTPSTTPPPPHPRLAPPQLTSPGRCRDNLQDTFLARASLSGSATGLCSRDSSMSVSTVMSAPRRRETEKEATGWPPVPSPF